MRKIAYCSFSSITRTVLSAKEMKNSALMRSLSEDQSIKRRSQLNCRTLKELQGRKNKENILVKSDAERRIRRKRIHKP